MAPSLFDLPPKVGLAYPAIVGGVRKDPPLSIAAIAALVRSTGVKMANETLRQAIRLTRDSFAYAERLKFLGNNARPNYDRLPLALGRQQRAYSFVVAVETGLFDVDGKAVKQRVTVVTDRQLTKGEIISAALSSLKDKERYGFDAENPQIETAQQAGFQGTL